MKALMLPTKILAFTVLGSEVTSDTPRRLGELSRFLLSRWFFQHPMTVASMIWSYNCIYDKNTICFYQLHKTCHQYMLVLMKIYSLSTISEKYNVQDFHTQDLHKNPGQVKLTIIVNFNWWQTGKQTIANLLLLLLLLREWDRRRSRSLPRDMLL